MRKVDPADVKSDFAAFVVERLAYFDRMSAHLLAKPSPPHWKKDLSVLSEMTLQSTYVAFEVFLSDLLLAYVNRDFSQYQAELATRIDASVRAKFRDFAADRTVFSPLKHIKIDDLEDVVDPTGWNQTFKDVAGLKKRFSEWVTPALGANVAAINASDTNLIDTTHAIRNFISHRSVSSKKVMNTALASMAVNATCPNNPLERGVHDVHDIGAYLKANTGGKLRIKIYMERLSAIALTL
ncbi:hypothetical protein [Burkholderia seminalis]|uniref:hypothetical protein n=1 Tax=Burkholderia seminalis TaxID=488731 RepID=UPI000A6797F6|nr:hypothetical protein [Burkholderia seminalis]